MSSDDLDFAKSSRASLNNRKSSFTLPWCVFLTSSPSELVIIVWFTVIIRIMISIFKN